MAALSYFSTSTLRGTLRAIERSALGVALFGRVAQSIREELTWRGIEERIRRAREEDDDLDSFPLVNIKRSVPRGQS
jgi:hypothetical protein